MIKQQRRAFLDHFHNAKKRSIPFLFSFEEWLGVWLDSGKWLERGPNKGQYVMARFKDQGAYEIGNVYICLAEENRSDRNKNYPMQGENNPAFGKNYWTELTEEQRNERADKIREYHLGRPKSDQMKQSLAKVAVGRRKIYRNGKATWAYPTDTDYPERN